MTPDKNNFQLLLQELEGLKVPTIPFGKTDTTMLDQSVAHNATVDKCIEIVTKHTAGHEREFREYTDERGVKSLYLSSGDEINVGNPSDTWGMRIRTKQDALILIHFTDQEIKILAEFLSLQLLSNTAPQPNLEEVEKLVQIETARKCAYLNGLDRYNTEYQKEVATVAASLRTRIGYTLDANGKPVLLPSSGSAITK